MPPHTAIYDHAFCHAGDRRVSGPWRDADHLWSPLIDLAAATPPLSRYGTTAKKMSESVLPGRTPVHTGYDVPSGAMARPL